MIRHYLIMFESVMILSSFDSLIKARPFILDREKDIFLTYNPKQYS